MASYSFHPNIIFIFITFCLALISRHARSVEDVQRTLTKAEQRYRELGSQREDLLNEVAVAAKEAQNEIAKLAQQIKDCEKDKEGIEEKLEKAQDEHADKQYEMSKKYEETEREKAIAAREMETLRQRLQEQQQLYRSRSRNTCPRKVDLLIPSLIRSCVSYLFFDDDLAVVELRDMVAFAFFILLAIFIICGCCVPFLGWLVMYFFTHREVRILRLKEEFIQEKFLHYFTIKATANNGQIQSYGNGNGNGTSPSSPSSASPSVRRGRSDTADSEMTDATDATDATDGFSSGGGCIVLTNKSSFDIDMTGCTIYAGYEEGESLTKDIITGKLASFEFDDGYLLARGTSVTLFAGPLAAEKYLDPPENTPDYAMFDSRTNGKMYWNDSVDTVAAGMVAAFVVNNRGRYLSIYADRASKVYGASRAGISPLKRASVGSRTKAKQAGAKKSGRGGADEEDETELVVLCRTTVKEGKYEL